MQPVLVTKAVRGSGSDPVSRFVSREILILDPVAIAPGTDSLVNTSLTSLPLYLFPISPVPDQSFLTTHPEIRRGAGP